MSPFRAGSAVAGVAIIGLLPWFNALFHSRRVEPRLPSLLGWTLLSAAACACGAQSSDKVGGEPNFATRGSSSGPASAAQVAVGQQGPMQSSFSSTSRAIPRVLLLGDAESGDPGFLPDEASSKAGAQMVGDWYTSDDHEDCPLELPLTGMISPPPGLPFFTTDYASRALEPFPSELDALNEHAYRIWGGGYSKWGAILAIGFNSPAGQPLSYDLTALNATGVRFWARSDVGDSLLRVKLSDKWSEPAAEPRMCCYLDPKLCGDNSCGVGDDRQGCFDSARFEATVSTAWQLFEVPFSSFVRIGFGTWADGLDHSFEPAVLSEAYQLVFEVGLDEQFDIYLDNVGLTLSEASDVE
jgi:hypothetical protein